MEASIKKQQYRLNSADTTHLGKSVFHVKLTDASLKALEENQKIRNRAKGAKIKFEGNSGEIVIPGFSGNNTFKFSLSNVTVDPLGSTECLSQQNKNLVTAGVLVPKKLTILATDDVYKATKEKISLAEEESKKNCTKVIKQSGPSVGRVVKKPARPSSLANLKVSVPDGKLTSRSKPSAIHAVAPAVAPAVMPAVAKQQTAGPPSSSSGSQFNSKVTSSVHLENRSSSSASGAYAGSVKPLGNSSTANYPYRDRIIHLLAVRPYKKIELKQTLEKGGSKDREKHSMTSILNQVATFNPHDNAYSLSRLFYGEVKEDWPFYSEDIRKEVKRKLSQCHEGLSSASISPVPVLSPCPSTESQGTSPTDSQKRSLSDEFYMPPKRVRIAHTQKGALPKSPTVTPPSSQPLSGADSNAGIIPQNSNTSKALAPVSSSTAAFLDQKKAPSSTLEGQENRNVSESSDILNDKRKYLPVTNAVQRRDYQNAFKLEYGEYFDLYKKITERTKIFKNLHQELQETSGKASEVIKNRIFREYEKLKKDSKYVRDRSRYEYLHKKLGHIKEMVQEFDTRQPVQRS